MLYMVLKIMRSTTMKSDYKQNQIEEIINDYKEQFEELDNVISSMIMTNLHLQLKSNEDWGKEFFERLIEKRDKCKCYMTKETYIASIKKKRASKTYFKIIFSNCEIEQNDNLWVIDKRDNNINFYEREVFKKYGPELYFQVISYYIRQYKRNLNKSIKKINKGVNNDTKK